MKKSSDSIVLTDHAIRCSEEALDDVFLKLMNSRIDLDNLGELVKQLKPAPAPEPAEPEPEQALEPEACYFE